jgi:heme/copper-type cytochrome/quinol oxidase subunit 1
MHWIGLLGMPRRVFTYSSELNLGGLNMAATAGGVLSAIGVLLIYVNVARSLRKGEKAGRNPWGAATLEWATESPPVEHNFQRVPTVHSREPLWLERERIEEAAFGERESFHMPPSSYWPVFTAIGVVGTFALFLTQVWWMPLLGVAWAAIGILNWAYEPV